MYSDLRRVSLGMSRRCNTGCKKPLSQRKAAAALTTTNQNFVVDSSQPYFEWVSENYNSNSGSNT
jgi:hypothetical protein